MLDELFIQYTWITSNYIKQKGSITALAAPDVFFEIYFRSFFLLLHRYAPPKNRFPRRKKLLSRPVTDSVIYFTLAIQLLSILQTLLCLSISSITLNILCNFMSLPPPFLQSHLSSILSHFEVIITTVVDLN